LLKASSSLSHAASLGFSHNPESLRQPHTHGRQNRFSFAASLQALETVLGTAEVSVDRSFTAKNFVERIAIRDYVLCIRNFQDCGMSDRSWALASFAGGLKTKDLLGSFRKSPIPWPARNRCYGWR
jgi:hypothetical protein